MLLPSFRHRIYPSSLHLTANSHLAIGSHLLGYISSILIPSLSRFVRSRLLFLSVSFPLHPPIPCASLDPFSSSPVPSVSAHLHELHPSQRYQYTKSKETRKIPKHLSIPLPSANPFSGLFLAPNRLLDLSNLKVWSLSVQPTMTRYCPPHYSSLLVLVRRNFVLLICWLGCWLFSQYYAPPTFPRYTTRHYIQPINQHSTPHRTILSQYAVRHQSLLPQHLYQILIESIIYIYQRTSIPNLRRWVFDLLVCHVFLCQ